MLLNRKYYPSPRDVREAVFVQMKILHRAVTQNSDTGVTKKVEAHQRKPICRCIEKLFDRMKRAANPPLVTPIEF